MNRQAACTLIVMVMLLAACAPVAAEAPTPTPEIFMPVPDEMRAEVAAREALAAQLGADMAAIATRAVEPADWPDNCLGLAVPGQACRIGATPGYRVVLDVETATYEVRTDARASTVLVAGRVDPLLGGLPPVCQGIGQATLYSPDNGFCFAYPAQFTLGEVNPTWIAIYGPALDDSTETLRATLHLEITPVEEGQSLRSLVDAYLDQFVDLPTPGPGIVRTALTVGGEPAERLEVVPCREGSRDVFLVRGGHLYHFIFMPSARDFPRAAAQVHALYMTITASFTFLPAPGAERAARSP